MYAIIQKIYEENKKVLQEGLNKVFNGDDVSSLTGAIKDFTDISISQLLNLGEAPFQFNTYLHICSGYRLDLMENCVQEPQFPHWNCKECKKQLSLWGQ